MKVSLMKKMETGGPLLPEPPYVHTTFINSIQYGISALFTSGAKAPSCMVLVAARLKPRPFKAFLSMPRIYGRQH
jgi:hypothetical protein